TLLLGRALRATATASGAGWRDSGRRVSAARRRERRRRWRRTQRRRRSRRPKRGRRGRARRPAPPAPGPPRAPRHHPAPPHPHPPTADTKGGGSSRAAHTRLTSDKSPGPGSPLSFIVFGVVLALLVAGVFVVRRARHRPATATAGTGPPLEAAKSPEASEPTK